MHFIPTKPSRLHADRTLGRDRHHRSLDRLALARRAGGSARPLVVPSAPTISNSSAWRSITTRASTNASLWEIPGAVAR